MLLLGKQYMLMIELSLKPFTEKRTVMEFGVECLWKGFQRVKYFCCVDVERSGSEYRLGRIHVALMLGRKVTGAAL
jgi:hypothetical protein